MESDKNRVELVNISKSFGGILALKDVTFKVKEGEIHALMGENGAGKSTLMKILSGAHQENSGKLLIDGQEVKIRNTSDSKNLGIGIIYQEFSLVPELSVAENIFLGRMTGDGSWINWRKINTEAEQITMSLGFDILPSAKIKNLSVAEQQIVEISKALSVDIDILILDEPSAVLGSHEIQKLYKVLRQLRNNGVAIIYISHRIEEIFELADRVTVLRNGYSTESHIVKNTSSSELIQLMLGRPLSTFFPTRNNVIGEEVLKIDNLRMNAVVDNVSLSVRSGEIVGIAGLVGSGRTETLQGIFASRKRRTGKIMLGNTLINPVSPYQAVKKGIGMVPEDRKKDGLIVPLSIKENISLTNYKAISRNLGFINKKKEEKRVNNLMEQLKVRARDVDATANTLSGGNQQKIVMSKWLNSDCKVLLIDEPTRGVDVGAKVEIYNEINSLAEKGLGVLVVSSETSELIGICDRILVMQNGSVAGELSKEEFSEEKVLRLAIGENKTLV